MDSHSCSKLLLQGSSHEIAHFLLDKRFKHAALDTVRFFLKCASHVPEAHLLVDELSQVYVGENSTDQNKTLVSPQKQQHGRADSPNENEPEKEHQEEEEIGERDGNEKEEQENNKQNKTRQDEKKENIQKADGRNNEADGKNNEADGKNNEANGKNNDADGKNNDADGKNNKDEQVTLTHHEMDEKLKQEELARASTAKRRRRGPETSSPQVKVQWDLATPTQPGEKVPAAISSPSRFFVVNEGDADRTDPSLRNHGTPIVVKLCPKGSHKYQQDGVLYLRQDGLLFLEPALFVSKSELRSIMFCFQEDTKESTAMDEEGLMEVVLGLHIDDEIRFTIVSAMALDQLQRCIGSMFCLSWQDKEEGAVPKSPTATWERRLPLKRKHGASTQAFKTNASSSSSSTAAASFTPVGGDGNDCDSIEVVTVTTPTGDFYL